MQEQLDGDDGRLQRDRHRTRHRGKARHGAMGDAIHEQDGRRRRLKCELETYRLIYFYFSPLGRARAGGWLWDGDFGDPIPEERHRRALHHRVQPGRPQAAR